MQRPAAVFLLLILARSPGGALGDEGRYELGQRLRRLETAWEQHPDAAVHARALPHVKEAVHNFLRFQPGEVARPLDEARFALESPQPPSAAAQWAASLALKTESRLIATTEPSLPLAIVAFYAVQQHAPEGVILTVTLRDPAGRVAASLRAAVGQVPWQSELRLGLLPEGDYELTAEITAGLFRAEVGRQPLSVAVRPDARIKKLEEAVAAARTKPRTTQRATLAQYLGICRSLRAKKTPEANYPAARLLAEAERLARAEAAGKDLLAGRPGEFWLTLADAEGSVPVRLFAPPGGAAGRARPLVVALHGAGGSENIFFDAYGRGKSVALCRRRGWLLVAPRVPLMGLGMSLERIVAETARWYPVDRKRVFVMGHSLGAAQAVASAAEVSRPLAAVAALGGAGWVQNAERLRTTAFFVAAGSEDFALGGARTLADKLRAAGVPRVQWKEYPGIEHLMIVAAAMEEVFAFFDASAPGGS